MRKLTLALAVGLLAATTGFGTAAPQARAATATKVVLVVGATEGTTPGYISQATALASHFSTYTDDVTLVLSPNATWSAVKSAAKGANFLVYLGHGSGWPNPYTGGTNLQPNGDNGMGLNSSAAGTHNNKAYYGENYMAQLELAPGALVLLNHLCYASGNNDSAYGGNPTLDVAKTRVEGYASGFLRAGAGAVLADGHDDLGDLVDSIFTQSTTIEALWRGMRGYDHVISWTSSRNPSAMARINPDTGGATPSGYYSSLVHTVGLTTTQIVAGYAAPFAPANGSYYPVAPTRVLDTRPGAVGPVGTVLARGVTNYQITGTYASTGVTIPATAIAVTANVTVTSHQASGWLYVGPEINGSPPASSINFLRGDNRANGITVGLSPRGTVAVWYGAKAGYTTHFVIDVTGYFVPGTAGAGYVAFGPERVLDTRDGTGLTGKFIHAQSRKIKIAGEKGLPASGIVAVAGNVTIVAPSAKGYVYLGPNPTNSPSSSTINFPAGDTRANNLVVPVNADGTVAATYVAATGATVDIVLDISGYYVATGGRLLYTVVPDRLLDSRDGTGGLSGPFTAKQVRTLQVTGAAGIPTGAIALVGNLTVVDQSAGGFAAIGPAITPDTNFSNLNFPAGDIRANGITVPLTAEGRVDLVYGARDGNTTHLLVDVCGYYMGNA